MYLILQEVTFSNKNKRSIRTYNAQTPAILSLSCCAHNLDCRRSLGGSYIASVTRVCVCVRAKITKMKK